MSPTLRTLTVVAALGCGAMGGVFFAFSTFVMAGLDRLPPAQGIAAMQSINITAVRPAFMTLLFGTAALCLAVGVAGFMSWGDRRSTLLLVGALVYLLGCIALTGGYHVPLNDSLATLDPHSAGAVAQWKDYVDHWTTWNHVRTVAGIGASLSFVAALLV
jgi:uncharacterized membrane protein